MNCSMPRVVDLFSGCGGLSEGFSQAGFDITVAVEKDAAAAKTYAANHPDTKIIVEDIRSVSPRELGVFEVDVVIGGFPCRPFSTANRQNQGRGHPDWPLHHEFLRIIRETNPRAFVIENVPAIDKSEGPHRARSVLNDIVEQASRLGFHTTHDVLNAAYFGVPQERERRFIIGSKGVKPFFPVPIELDTDDWVTVADAISDLPEAVYTDINRPQRFAYCSEPQGAYQEARRRDSGDVVDHLCTKHGNAVIQRYKTIPPGCNWHKIPRRLLAHTNTKNMHSNLYRRLDWQNLAPTIAHIRKCHLIHPSFHRTLSAREGARLQSFNDTYHFYGNKDQVYQQIADAVPPLLARAVAQHLIKHL